MCTLGREHGVVIVLCIHSIYSGVGLAVSETIIVVSTILEKWSGKRSDTL